MVRAARLRTRLHLPRGDLASARGVSPCTPARRCASCARSILGSSELSMRFAVIHFTPRSLRAQTPRRRVSVRSARTSKVRPQTTHKTQESHAHHTHRQPQQGRTPPSASLQTREGVHVHSCCLGAAGGTRGHLFSRSIDVHGGPKQGGAGAPASDLADGDARVRAQPALRKRPHALRPGTALGPLTMYPPSGL